ncbi:universal stress protein [Kineosporia sp. NBRC 101731]|uniref:universal stress protein n=1 Tax=Kineosporia sp. NBRC 101731 TaxID=3032199 RepID=UPI0024A4AE0E|nr:universal stress protein [Kineosporia sp. NBRC 101731]GLY33528.1 universal stress protein [Kineosporia sp. NBRC 101731]
MTVLLAHTPHASAEAAFESALEQAIFRDTDLVLVNATKGETLVDPKYATDEALTEFSQRAAGRGVGLSIERPVDADIAAAVLTVAGRYDTDLIVLGVRHRSAVGKFLLGSVAQRIILDADCPVLAVKADTIGAVG